MIEDELYRRLKPMVGGQVYPYVAPLKADGQPSVSPPLIIYSIISDVCSDVLVGQSESGVSVQVDVYAGSRKEARDLCDEALALLQPLNPTNISKIPGYEPDRRLYRATLEFLLIV